MKNIILQFQTLEVRHRLHREGHVIVVFMIVVGDRVRCEGVYKESQPRVGHDGFEELDCTRAGSPTLDVVVKNMFYSWPEKSCSLEQREEVGAIHQAA